MCERWDPCLHDHNNFVLLVHILQYLFPDVFTGVRGFLIAPTLGSPAQTRMHSNALTHMTV